MKKAARFSSKWLFSVRLVLLNIYSIRNLDIQDKLVMAGLSVTTNSLRQQAYHGLTTPAKAVQLFKHLWLGLFISVVVLVLLTVHLAILKNTYSTCPHMVET